MSYLHQPLTITVDHAQTRIYDDRQSILIEGSLEANQGRVTGWDIPNSSGIWQEQVTWTAMLQPTVLDGSWDTSTGGSHARLSTGDFTITSTAGWSDIDVSGSLGYMTCPSCSNDVLISNSSLAINQPMMIRFYAGGGADDRVVMEGGWSNSGGATDHVALRVWLNGTVEVWKSSELVKSGKISGAQNSQTLEGWVTLFLIPYRRRELLVVSSMGDGFSLVFDDLLEDGTVKTITPAVPFWLRIPTGSMTMQVAKLQFATSGTLLSPSHDFPDAPEVGQTLGKYIAYDKAGYGSQGVSADCIQPSSLLAFSPDGTLYQARAKLTLTSDGASTPFVYGAELSYAPTYQQTNDSEQASIPWTGELSIEVPDSPAGEFYAWHLKGYSLKVTVPKLEAQANRPVKLSAQGVSLIDGRGRPPEVMKAQEPQADLLSMTVDGPYQALVNYRFQQDTPLDGMTWLDALQFVVSIADPATPFDVTDPGITLGSVSGQSAGQWNLLIEAGDTAAHWVERLFEAYAGGWFYGYVPTTSGRKFIGRPPSAIGTSVDVNLFITRAAAKAQLISEGFSSADAEFYASLRLVNELTLRAVAPEANDVRVTGLDLRLNQPIKSKYVDAASKNPTTPPSARPDNWIGEPKRYGFQDRIITTQSLADASAALLGDRNTRGRVLADMQADMIFLPDGVTPLWRGHTVSIEGILYRVLSVRVRVEKDASDDPSDSFWQNACRPATYCLESVDVGTPWGVATGQLDSIQIMRAMRRRLARVSGFVGAVAVTR